MTTINNKQEGFVLITSVMILMAMLLVGSYLISSSDSENKISQAQTVATRDYYLAETGINEMLWKIQNNPTTKNNFLAGTLSESDSITRNNVLGDSRASYNVAAINTTSSEAWIIATATYQLADHVSQRVVKSYISKATNNYTNPWPFSTFSGGRGGQQNGNFNFTGSGVVLILNGGRLHANQVLKVQKAEIQINDGVVSSSNVINETAGGKITLNNSYRSVPTSTVDMLQIDFDSSDPNSWKSRATAVYSTSQFNSLPNNTTLNGIIFVNGNASVVGKNMTINGVLVTSGSFSLTEAGQNFTVNFDPAYGGGILSKGNLFVTTSGGTILLNGLIYSGNNLNFTSSGTNFIINGAIAGFDSNITASGGAITLNYTPANIAPVTDPTYNPNAPLIVITHWEEEY